MIHAAFGLVMIVFDVIGAWLKHDLGAADYRIVRVVFFSAFATWAAFAIARTASALIHGLSRLVIVRIPHGAFRLLCKIVRDVENGVGRFARLYHEWQAARKRQRPSL
jgi:hypothetical protein